MNHADAPSTPGVYLLLGAGAEVRYVGKATDLRRRLRDHARSRRWTDIADVRWIACGDEGEALCLEADLIVATRPVGNAAVTLDELIYVCVSDDRFSLTRMPEARPYGGFPHLGKGKASWPAVRQKAGYAALLRLLWFACAAGERPPSRLRGDSPPADHRAPISEDLRQSLHAFLSGSSSGLLRRLSVEEAPVLERKGLVADLEAARAFFRLGPRRIRELRLRHGERAPVDEATFRRMVLADLRAAIGDVSVAERSPDVARGRIGRSLERRSGR